MSSEPLRGSGPYIGTRHPIDDFERAKVKRSRMAIVGSIVGAFLMIIGAFFIYTGIQWGNLRGVIFYGPWVLIGGGLTVYYAFSKTYNPEDWENTGWKWLSQTENGKSWMGLFVYRILFVSIIFAGIYYGLLIQPGTEFLGFWNSTFGCSIGACGINSECPAIQGLTPQQYYPDPYAIDPNSITSDPATTDRQRGLCECLEPVGDGENLTPIPFCTTEKNLSIALLQSSINQTIVTTTESERHQCFNLICPGPDELKHWNDSLVIAYFLLPLVGLVLDIIHVLLMGFWIVAALDTDRVDQSRRVAVEKAKERQELAKAKYYEQQFQNQRQPPAFTITPTAPSTTLAASNMDPPDYHEVFPPQAPQPQREYAPAALHVVANMLQETPQQVQREMTEIEQHQSAPKSKGD